MLGSVGEYRRRHVETLVERLSEPPLRLIAVFGPRQTGKTTAVCQALESLRLPYRFEAVDMPGGSGPALPSGPLVGSPGRVVDSPGRSRGLGAASRRSDGVRERSGAVRGLRGAVREHSDGVREQLGAVRDLRWLTETWEHSRRRAWESERGFILVFDEIQSIRGWSRAVKGLWDHDRRTHCPLHAVILGSAPLLMQAGLSESLAGRFEPVRVTHWAFPEMADAFGWDLEQYVYFGGYPGAACWARDVERWTGYVHRSLIEPNIKRDVLAMTRVDKPALLRNLFELGSVYSGQQLSYNKMLGQLSGAGNTTTLARYLNLLGDAGLLTGLSKHAKRPVLARASSPKLNVLNTALMAVASGYTFDEARADRTQWGRMVESAVGAHLLNTASQRTDVRYWREGDREVDFVLHRGPRTAAIEVKSSKRRPVRRSGLAEFERRFHPQAAFIVGHDVELGEFLSHSADHWLNAA